MILLSKTRDSIEDYLYWATDSRLRMIASIFALAIIISIVSAGLNVAITGVGFFEAFSVVGGMVFGTAILTSILIWFE